MCTSFYCNLTLDGVINNTGAAGNLPLLATNNTLINRAITNIADGTHLWNVTCWDPTNATSNTATSATRRVIVDANAPELITPNVNNGSWWNSATVNFNWTATNTGTSVLYCNVTIDGVINSSTQTAASTVMARYSASGLANGVHTWYSNCSTYLNTWNTTGSLSPSVQALWVDTAAPAITLNNSAILTDGYNTTATAITFNWTATDNVVHVILLQPYS